MVLFLSAGAFLIGFNFILLMCGGQIIFHESPYLRAMVSHIDTLQSLGEESLKWCDVLILLRRRCSNCYSELITKFKTVSTRSVFASQFQTCT
ncbi:hypothetical protein DFH09DRAFT_1189957 [Mycena vulgaris]|nr:hypothetical protein DFH09DRAFT_1189957 [Mycena vulgaris]